MPRPTFFIIGAPKAGSTSLYQYLQQHPQVFMPALKEPRYYGYLSACERHGGPLSSSTHAYYPIRDEAAYQALFADAGDAHAIGEASVPYLEMEGTAAMIRRHLPEARCIAILRHPAERAYSHYLMAVRAGKEQRSFAEAVAASKYLYSGYYARHLQGYVDAFPREQLFICLQDDLRADPVTLMQRIYAFVGVDATFTPDTGFRHNVGGRPKNRLVNYLMTRTALNDAIKRMLPGWLVRGAISVKRLNYEAEPMDPGVRAQLIDQYRDDIRELEGLLDRDLQHWLS